MLDFERLRRGTIVSILALAVLGGCSYQLAKRPPAERRPLSPAKWVDVPLATGLPVGLASDARGNVYVADGYGNRILRVASDGTVAVLAGSGKLGYRDGPGAVAEFAMPHAVAVDRDGNVVVADALNSLIRRIAPDGTVTTVAGDYRWYADRNMKDRNGTRDGQGTQARFDFPGGVAVDSAGNIYVADTMNRRIRKIAPDGAVSTLSGTQRFLQDGYADGPPDEAKFHYPTAVALGPNGILYVADNNAVRVVAADGSVSTLAGGRKSRIAARERDIFRYAGGYANGGPQTAEFANPVALAVDSTGNIYVADENNKAIRRVAPDGRTTTVVDLTAYYPTPGPVPTARPGAPMGIAVLPDDGLVIAVPAGLFKIAPGGR